MFELVSLSAIIKGRCSDGVKEKVGWENGDVIIIIRAVMVIRAA